MIYITTDEHFWNHVKLVEIGLRALDFSEQYLEECQRLLSPSDTLINLGDTKLGAKKDEAQAMLRMTREKKNNCFEILIRGNHDTARSRWYEYAGFSIVLNYLVKSNIIYSHAPIQPLPPNIKYNVHGHFHLGGHHLNEEAYGPESYWAKNIDRYKLLSLEITKKPVPLYEWLESQGIKV